MTTPRVREYWQRLDAAEGWRAAAGGERTPEEESEWASAMDAIWDAMTVEERQEADSREDPRRVCVIFCPSCRAIEDYEGLDCRQCSGRVQALRVPTLHVRRSLERQDFVVVDRCDLSSYEVALAMLRVAATVAPERAEAFAIGVGVGSLAVRGVSRALVDTIVAAAYDGVATYRASEAETASPPAVETAVETGVETEEGRSS